MPDVTRDTILEWATAAKRQAEAADLDPMPSDEALVRAAVALNMMTRGPYPVMRVVTDEPEREEEAGRRALPPSLEFNRASAIVFMAISFDDDPPNTQARAALFEEVLRA